MRTAAALASSLLVFLVVGELLARATGILDRLNGYTRLLYVDGPDADLPYLLRPDLTSVMHGVTIQTNRLGLREAEIGPQPAPGVRRVLLLGDSVVFGHQLPADAVLARQLEDVVAREHGVRIEAVNMGVPGYDTVSAVRLFESLGLGLGPHAVVLGVSLNDYDVTPQYSAFGVLVRKPLEARSPGIVDSSEFLTVLRWLVRWGRGRLGVQIERALEAQANRPGEPASLFAAPALVASVRDEHLGFYAAPVPAYWNRMQAALARLGRLCEERDLPLVVAIFPESYQVGVADPDRTPQRRLLAACDDAGIACLDLQPTFAAAGGALFLDVSHPNAAGHALAARAIAAALRLEARP